MPQTQPNIILIISDQQRGDAIGVDPHAPPCLQTPNLDAMAARGAHFRRAYSECPTCAPARRTIFSGLAPAAHGMVGMTNMDFDLPAKLPRCLRDAGYQTYLVGKTHLFPGYERHGFDHQVKAEATRGNISDCRYTQFLARHGHLELRPGSAHGVDSNSWIGRPSNLPEHLSHSYWCISEALDFLEFRDKSCPFFLNIGLIDPHPPFTPPQWYYDRYLHAQLPPPAIGDWAQPDQPTQPVAPQVHGSYIDLPPDARRHSLAGYYGLINHIDSQVGRLIQYLRDRKLLDNTLLLYTSDHGDMLGDHYRTSKAVAFEGSARVPLIITPPKTWDLHPIVSDAPVGLQDIMPTLLDIAGIHIPPHCTGKSLLPLLRGHHTPPRDYIHGEHQDQYGKRDACHYLTDGQYKYIWLLQRDQELLFDLQADPRETHDISAEQPDRLHTWRQRLIHILRDRPEGFVADGQLQPHRPYEKIIPDYQPGTVLPYI